MVTESVVYVLCAAVLCGGEDDATTDGRTGCRRTTTTVCPQHVVYVRMDERRQFHKHSRVIRVENEMEKIVKHDNNK